ncbi:MAG: hypothetical protein RL701_6826 [Pseudomonadota bacterium]|jgi:hypothetical protein
MKPHDVLEQLIPGPGWQAFVDPNQYWRVALVLISATLSGTFLAFHPVYRGRPVTLDMLEQRKTIIIYSSVGALISTICTVAPSMAFVIFGIGGLMRFRTNTGESATTGQTIMGTLIGLCWGLGLQLVATVATLYFWLMIYLLEAAVIRTLTVGIDAKQMQVSAENYRDALRQAGCRVLAHGKLFNKSQMTFVVQIPRGIDALVVQRALTSIPEELRGHMDWPE